MGGAVKTENRWLQSYPHLNLDPASTKLSSKRKGHGDLSGDQLDLMQGSRAAQGSGQSILVPMVAQACMLPCSLEELVPRKSCQLPSQFESPEEGRKSPDALLSAGIPCGRGIIAKGYLSGSSAHSWEYAVPCLAFPEQCTVAWL